MRILRNFRLEAGMGEEPWMVSDSVRDCAVEFLLLCWLETLTGFQGERLPFLCTPLSFPCLSILLHYKHEHLCLGLYVVNLSFLQGEYPIVQLLLIFVPVLFYQLLKERGRLCVFSDRAHTYIIQGLGLLGTRGIGEIVLFPPAKCLELFYLVHIYFVLLYFLNFYEISDMSYLQISIF